MPCVKERHKYAQSLPLTAAPRIASRVSGTPQRRRVSKDRSAGALPDSPGGLESFFYFICWDEILNVQAQLDNVLREKELIAASEHRLQQEMEMQRVERQGNTQLLATVQSLKNEFDRAENEAKIRLNAQIDSLQVTTLSSFFFFANF
jgi:hypothetical protein